MIMLFEQLFNLHVVFSMQLNQRLSSLSFDQNWTMFKDGFGSCDGNYWMGLQSMYEITNSGQYSFRLEANCKDG